MTLPSDGMAGLGFSELETALYRVLLKDGDQSAYQLGKTLGVARSRVYPALDALRERGAVHLVPGAVQIFTAEDPRVLMRQLRAVYERNIEAAGSDLFALRGSRTDSRFVNIEGRDAVLARACELVETAQQELLINTDLCLGLLHDCIEQALARGVRIVVFSWSDLDLSGLPVEYYTRSEPVSSCTHRRLILVSDMKELLASGDAPDRPGGFNGYITANSLMVRLAAEHIHLDIYMRSLMLRYGHGLIDRSIQIGSMLEKEGES